MNIGIVTTWFERGAAYVSKQFEEVLGKEFNVFIYARGGEKINSKNPIWEKDNVTIGKKMILPTVATPMVKSDFIKWIKINQIQAVLFNEQHWFIPILWCKEIGIKTICYIDYYKLETISLFGIYDCLICNTQRHYETFKWHPNVHYLPWGTNLKLFKPKDTDSNSNVFFHSVGMAPFRKGTDILLKAYYNSSKKWKLLIHTQTSIDCFDAEIHKIIQELIRLNKLEIVEKTITAPGLYHLGDVYVYPSRLDGIGLTVAESMACGLVPLVSDNPPMNEFVCGLSIPRIKIGKYISRSDGYYWPMSICDDNDLTQCLEYYMNNLTNEQLCVLKTDVLEYASKKLDWDVNSAEINYILTNLLTTDTHVDHSVMKKAIIKYESFGIKRFNYLFEKFQCVIQLIRKLC